MSKKGINLDSLRVDVNEDDETDKNANFVTEISVEETNKLRASLGLAPLEAENKEGKDDEFTVVNVREKFMQEKRDNLREKLDTKREKRRNEEFLSTIRTVAESVDDSELDDTKTWVDKMKSNMDVKNVEIKKNIVPKKKKSSRGVNLVTVKHDVEELKNLEDKILVIGDKSVLDDSKDNLQSLKYSSKKSTTLKAGGYENDEEETLNEKSAIVDMNSGRVLNEDVEEASQDREKHGESLDLFGGNETKTEKADDYFDEREAEKMNKKMEKHIRKRKRQERKTKKVVSEEVLPAYVANNEASDELSEDCLKNLTIKKNGNNLEYLYEPQNNNNLIKFDKHVVLDDTREFVNKIANTIKETNKQEQYVYAESMDIKEDQPIFNEIISEEKMDKGLFSTLKLINEKGYTKKASEPEANQKQNSSKDSSRIHIDYSRKLTNKNEIRGQQRFPEKRDYDPEINLNSVDDEGNVLTMKEAYRRLSHQWHGNRPGKIKSEKRKKALNNRIKMDTVALESNNISSGLKVMEMMEKKLKTQKTPYLILSGAKKGDIVKGEQLKKN